MGTSESNFDRFLNAALHKYRLSQKELAEVSGLRPASISDFANGKKAPSYENIIKIVNALRISLSEFFALTTHDEVQHNDIFLSAVKNVLHWFDELSQIDHADSAEDIKVKLADELNCGLIVVNEIIAGQRQVDDKTRRVFAKLLGFPGTQYGDFLQIGAAHFSGGDKKNKIATAIKREKELMLKMEKLNDIIIEQAVKIRELEEKLLDHSISRDADAAIQTRPVKKRKAYK